MNITKLQNKENNFKSYYAVIPAAVRYDKKLSANAKLLFGELTALANDKGYCWASNGYFSSLYGVRKESISRWLKQLKDGKYISLKVTYKQGTKEIKERRIYIADPIDKKLNTARQNCQHPNYKKRNTPIDKNVKDNTTVINNTFNKSEIGKNQFNSLLEINEIINYKDYFSLLNDWLTYNKQKRKNLTTLTIKRLLIRWEKLGLSAATEKIEYAIDNNYTGWDFIISTSGKEQKQKKNELSERNSY